jgi:hypothetical protein
MIAVVVVMLAIASLSGPVRSEEPARPAVPRNLVAFVTGGECPAGWQPNLLSIGRLLIGTDQGDVVGRVVGTALDAVEDRAHVHTIGSATIALPYQSISAGDGGNQAGAGAGAQPVTGTAGEATSRLPFVQLTTCRMP